MVCPFRLDRLAAIDQVRFSGCEQALCNLLCDVTNTLRAVMMNPRCPLSKRSLPMQAVLWPGPRNETISASSGPDFCTILLPEPIGATLTSQLTRRTCVR